jgi:hypothetical protein
MEAPHKCFENQAVGYQVSIFLHELCIMCYRAISSNWQKIDMARGSVS